MSKISLSGLSQQGKFKSSHLNIFDEQAAFKGYLLFILFLVLAGDQITNWILLPKLSHQAKSDAKKGYFALYLGASVFYVFSFYFFRKRKSPKNYIIQLAINMFACLLLVFYFSLETIDSLEKALEMGINETWSLALENLSCSIYLTLFSSILIPPWYLNILIPSSYYFSIILVYWRANHSMKYWMLVKGAFNLILVALLTLIKSKARFKLLNSNVELERLNKLYKSIIDKIPSAICLMDLDQNIIFSNKEFIFLLEKFNKNKQKLFENLEQLKKRNRFTNGFPSNYLAEIKTKSLDPFQDFSASIPEPQKEDFEYNITGNLSPPKSQQTGKRLSCSRRTTLLNNIQIPKVNLENISLNIDSFQKSKNLRELLEKLWPLLQGQKDIVSFEDKDLIYDGKLSIFDSDTQLKSGELLYEIRLIPLYKDKKLMLVLNETTQRDSLASQEYTTQYKDRLLASISHQIRTPLNGNLSCLQATLSDSRVPKVIKDCLIDPALKSSKLLLHVVNDILDFSHIQTGEFQLSLETKNICDTFMGAFKLLEKAIKLKRLEYIFDFDLNSPGKITTDHERLTQIVLNLLNNALKFTFSGKIVLKITCANPSYLSVSVQDTGIGMSESEIQVLLAELENPALIVESDKKSKGIGLGLKISNYLIKHLEPKNKEYSGLKIESFEGKGSCFSFQIENKVFELEELDDIDELRLDDSPGNNVEEFQDDMSGSDISSLNELDKKYNKFAESYSSFKRIDSPFKQIFASNKSITNQENNKSIIKDVLVVDDDPINILGLRLLLSKLNLSIDAVYNGQQAIEKIQEKFRQASTTSSSKYKLIFMDCQMPVMDGYEATKVLVQMMKDAQIPVTPIIGCTAFTAKNKLDECLTCGMNGVITKPVSLEKLRKTVRKFMKQNNI